MRNGSIGDGAQADENLRKNSRLNYELAALPGELRRRIWPRKIAGKYISSASLFPYRFPWIAPDDDPPTTRDEEKPARVPASLSVSVTGRKTKTIKLKSPAEERLPAAHLPTELVVARGGHGDVKSLGHHRCRARAA